MKEPLEPVRIGDDDACELCLAVEVPEVLFDLGSGWTAEPVVLVLVDDGRHVFAAGRGLFGLDFGAEA